MKKLLLAVAALAVLGAGDVALAQQSSAPEAQDTVRTRDRSEFDPLGVRVGSFLVFPKLEVEEEFNSNVYATEDNERADLITKVKPELRVNSNWNTHALNFRTSADVGFYMDETDEDYQDYRGAVDGRFDILRTTNLTGEVGYVHGHEARGSPDATNGINPTQFDNVNWRAAFQHRFNRLTLRPYADATYRNFHDDNTSARGVPGQINNDDRDRDEYRFGGRATYEIVPSYSAFLDGSYADVNYKSRRDDGGFNRDNNGWRLRAGALLDLTGVTQGEVFAGYLQRYYDDARFDTLGVPEIGARLTWNATRLTTVRLGVSRQILETTLATASGNLSSRAELSAEHELMRNLIVNADTSIGLDEFQKLKGARTERDDTNYAAGVGAKYAITRNFFLNSGYKFRHRQSTGGPDFTQHSVTLSVGAQL